MFWMKTIRTILNSPNVIREWDLNFLKNLIILFFWLEASQCACDVI